MKKLWILLFICAALTACASKEETEVPKQEQDAAVEEQEITKIVYPLPATIDMENLTDCTVAVAFEKENIYVDENAAAWMDVTVYTYDLYDMVDISMLEEGDTIVIRDMEILIDTLERTDYGNVVINGGLENLGYELATNSSGVYYETNFSDVKAHYEIGKATLPVAENFVFTDKSDLDNDPVTYEISEFLKEEPGFYFFFIPNNTTIVIENGVVTAMERVYVP